MDVIALPDERNGTRTAGRREGGLTLSTTVAVARQRLDASRRDADVVMEGDEPVGVITRAALDGRPGRRPLPEALLCDVVDLECVPNDPEAAAPETVRAYSLAAMDSLRRRRPCADETIARRAATFRPT